MDKLGRLSEPLLEKEGAVSSESRTGRTATSETLEVPESPDLESAPGDVQLKNDLCFLKKKENFQSSIRKGILVILVVLMTGVVGLGINMAVETIIELKSRWILKFMTSHRHASSLVLYGSNVALVLLSAVLVVYMSPTAAGSGIPEVKAYIYGVDIPDNFNPKTLFIKVFGCVGSIAGGLKVGMVGPMVHIGSCIASIIGQGSWFQIDDNDLQEVFACGSAAGIAAALRAPLGGALFASQSLLPGRESHLLWQHSFMISTALMALIQWKGVTYKWYTSVSLGLYSPREMKSYVSQGMQDNYAIYLIDIFVIIFLVGVIGGVIGALFNHVNSKVVASYGRWLKERWSLAKVLLACAMAVITSACSYGLPFSSIFGECKMCPKELVMESALCPADGWEANFRGLYCFEGQYNDLATLSMNTNDNVIQNLFSTATPRIFSMSSLLTYFLCSYILALLTSGIPVPLGLFGPLIICGATFGRVVGVVRSSVGGRGLDEGSYALLGAASLLGGSMRMTLSICVILCELTNNMMLFPLIIIVLLISKKVGDFFNDAIIDLQMRGKRIPLLPAKLDPTMQQLSAADAINTSTALVWFNRHEKVRTVMETLRSTSNNSFAIQANEGHTFDGLALRSHIMHLLKRKKFLGTATSRFSSVKLQKFDFQNLRSASRQGVTNLQIAPDEEDMYVDLGSVTDAFQIFVLETTPLAMAFTLFQRLDLHHLCVLPSSREGPPIIGLLTRRDFMPEGPRH